MAKYAEQRQIEWGDCDAAGIVFYPNYFRWMDSVFHRFTQSLGFDQRTLAAQGYLGTPLVDVACTFRSPARYYETLAVSLGLCRVGGASLTLDYTFHVAERLVAEGREVRAFVAENDTSGISAKPPPNSIRIALEGALAP